MRASILKLIIGLISVVALLAVVGVWLYTPTRATASDATANVSTSVTIRDDSVSSVKPPSNPGSGSSSVIASSTPGSIHVISVQLPEEARPTLQSDISPTVSTGRSVSPSKDVFIPASEGFSPQGAGVSSGGGSVQTGQIKPIYTSVAKPWQIPQRLTGLMRFNTPAPAVSPQAAPRAVVKSRSYVVCMAQLVAKNIAQVTVGFWRNIRGLFGF